MLAISALMRRTLYRPYESQAWMHTSAKVMGLKEQKRQEQDMEKKIPYTEITNRVIEQVEGGERFIVTSTEGKEVAALVPREGLEILKEFEKTQDEIDHRAVEEGDTEDGVTSWEDYKKDH